MHTINAQGYTHVVCVLQVLWEWTSKKHKLEINTGQTSLLDRYVYDRDHELQASVKGADWHLIATHVILYWSAFTTFVFVRVVGFNLKPICGCLCQGRL